MSYRIVILPYISSDGVAVAPNPRDSWADDVVPEGADQQFIAAVVKRWSCSPIGRPLKIYTRCMNDLRLVLLQQELEDEHSFPEEEYQVITEDEFQRV